MEQVDLLRTAVYELQQLAVPHAIVGSFASGVWGETRFTQDVDILVDLKPHQVNSLCNAFAAPEFYVSPAAARDAVTAGGQFKVIHPTSGNKIDCMVASQTRWAIAQLARCKLVPIFADMHVSVAAPEDVVLGKLVYYHEGHSEKHLRDIAGILRISGEYVDRDYISRFANELGVSDIWQAVVTRVDESNAAD